MAYGFDFHKFDENKFDEKSLEVIESDVVPADDLIRKTAIKNLHDSEVMFDDSHRVIKPSRNEIHGVSDSFRFDVKAKRETIQELVDEYNAQIVDYTAVVIVGGYSIRVSEGLTISDSSNDRVSTCSFQIPNVQDWMMDILRIRADIHVMLFDGDTTEHFGGRIVANPVSWRGHSPFMSIEAEDYTATADDYTVNQSYRNKFVHEIVHEMWTEFYDEEIEFDIQPSTMKIPIISFNFETLFDAMETLAEQVGWTWFIDWDGSKKTLRFFSPETNVFPQRLGWGERNVLEDGFEFGEDYEMFNALYLFGGEAESLPITEKDMADGERYVFSFAYEPTDITILVDDVEQRIGIENIHNFDEDDVDCLVNYREKTLRFPEDSPPVNGAIIEKIYRYRYPVVTYIEDGVSIEKYGKIVKEIREPNITDIGFAQERARYLLREHSTPKIYGKMNVRRVHGLRAGHVVEVYLPNIGVEGFFEVMEVQKVALARRIDVSISVNKIENPETEIARKLKEFAKRIRELEKKDIDENTVVHRYNQEFENLLISENVFIESRTAGVSFFDDARFSFADFA